MKLKLGMIGGGQGAFIGAVHRIAARIDGDYELVCGAFSSDPEKSKASGVALGLSADRSYSSYQELIEKEKQTFLFWTEFFMEAIDSGKEITSSRFPVLIQEVNKEYMPSYITINVNDVIILSHVLENSQKKSPPPGIHRWEFKVGDIRAVSANKRDNRSMFLYLPDNSEDYCLTFPSVEICNRVIEMMECDGKVLHDCGVQNQIQVSLIFLRYLSLTKMF